MAAGRSGGTRVELHDPRAGWYAIGFLVLLLASEAALTLPDESAADADVARFYAAHRVVIVVLQVAGFAAAAAFGAYAWRLRGIRREPGAAGLLLAVLALLPGLLTIAVAVVADPADPGAAGRLNRLLPRADDALFLGVLLFAVAVLVWLRQGHAGLAVVAGVTAAACLARFGLEVAGRPRGAPETVAPLCFLALVAWLAALSFQPVRNGSAVSA